MKKFVLILSISALFVTACSSGGGTREGGYDARSAGFQLRQFQEETLSNGLRILWIPDSSLPRISMNMMVQSGVLDEDKGEAGLNSFTANLLDQGTAKKSAPQLADALDQIGSDFVQNPGADFTTLISTGLTSKRSEILALFSEIILTPSFPDVEVNRRKSITLAAIQKTQDHPSSYADELADRAIFGEHPYGTAVMGTMKSVKSFRRADALRQYFAFYRPNNSILSVVGSYDESFKQDVRKAFEGWQSTEIRRPTQPKIDIVPEKIMLVSKPALQQTQIRIGQLGIKRSDPDFLALRMGSVILGGAFASRLNQKIRDDLGLTYSIHSNSDAKLERGSFDISTFSRHEKASDVILETRKLVADFVQKGITKEELNAAKALLIGQFPAALETPDKTAYNLMVLRRYGISDDYLRNFQKEVAAMTLDHVNQAIRMHLHPDKLQTIIYSDEKALESQLGRLGTVEKIQASPL